MREKKEKKPNVRFDVERAIRTDMNPNLKPHARLVLYAIGTYADERGFANPSQATLAKACGWSSVRSVRGGLAIAKAHGYVRVHQGGDGSPAYYCLKMPGTMCGHDRLAADLAEMAEMTARQPVADLNGSSPATYDASSAIRVIQPGNLVQQPGNVLPHNTSNTLKAEHIEQEELDETSNGPVLKSGEPEFSAAFEANEIISGAIRGEFPKSRQVREVLQAITLELDGGERNGLAEWSGEGTSYVDLLEVMREEMEPEDMRELRRALSLI